MRYLVCLCFAFLVFSVAQEAVALDLATARMRGLVGEDSKGYIEAVGGNPSDEVKALLTEVNKKRKEEYKSISGKNNQPLDNVAEYAAFKIIENLPSGAYYKDASGTWIKKK